MFFTSPIFLFAIVPWAGVFIWVLRNRRRRMPVPFVQLWRGGEQVKRSKRPLEIPPLSVLALLLAILLAILAAAGPAILRRTGGINQITVVVDRGLEMSLQVDGRPRYALAADEAAKAIDQFAPSASMELRVVPDAEPPGKASIGAVQSLGPTGANDPESVIAAARTALAATTGPVLVLSDIDLGFSDSRLAQFGVKRPIENVGIEVLSARADPKPAVMVRVLNQSSRKSGALVIDADGQTIHEAIELPEAGKSRDYFFDLPSAARVVHVSLEGTDELALDRDVWCVKLPAWPAIEARSGLPEDLRRMIEVYTKNRPVGEGSIHVAVMSASDAMPTAPAALVVTVGNHPLADAQPTVAAGPIDLSSVDWRQALQGASLADLPSGDWKVVVSSGGKPAVAVRDAPARQVWVGFVSPDFSRRADFVVLWNAVFQWLGDGSDEYVSRAVGRLTGKWERVEPMGSILPGDLGLQPGLYQRADGAMRAINAYATPFAMGKDIESGEEKLAEFPNRQAGARVNLRGPVITAALVLIGVSMLLWDSDFRFQNQI